MKRPRLDLNGVEWQRHCWGRRQDAARARVHANCLLARMYRVLNGRGQADSLPARARLPVEKSFRAISSNRKLL